MTAPRVLVVGSANVDFTVAVPRLPQSGETVSEGTLLVNHGGKGANQAVAARRLGAETRFIGCVGDDASGQGIMAALAGEGIGVGGVAVASAATGTALIVVDREGRNQIAVAPGANRALAVEHVHARAEDFAWAHVVVCSLEVPLDAVQAALALARARGVVTVLNPAPVPARAFDAWSLVDYLTPNEGEAERLSGVPGALDGARALRARGVGTVLVTLGSDGVLMCGPASVEQCPAYAVSVIDTTAAGDAFNAGLAVALAEATAAGAARSMPTADLGGDGTLSEAIRLASATAALTCTRRGAQDALPRRADVERLLRR